MNFNTLKPAYNGTASDGIFTVGNMFRLFIFFFYILLTVHLSIFILVINPYPTNVENMVSS